MAYLFPCLLGQRNSNHPSLSLLKRNVQNVQTSLLVYAIDSSLVCACVLYFLVSTLASGNSLDGMKDRCGVCEGNRQRRFHLYLKW